MKTTKLQLYSTYTSGGWEKSSLRFLLTKSNPLSTWAAVTLRTIPLAELISLRPAWNTYAVQTWYWALRRRTTVSKYYSLSLWRSLRLDRVGLAASLLSEGGNCFPLRLASWTTDRTRAGCERSHFYCMLNNLTDPDNGDIWDSSYNAQHEPSTHRHRSP